MYIRLWADLREPNLNLGTQQENTHAREKPADLTKIEKIKQVPLDFGNKVFVR